MITLQRWCLDQAEIYLNKVPFTELEDMFMCRFVNCAINCTHILIHG